MGKAKAEVKAATEEEDEDIEEYDTDAGEGDDDFELERDSTGKLTGVKIVNAYVGAHQNFFLRRYSMVMVLADEGNAKYLGYISELMEMPRDIQALICWFYRVCDLKEAPSDLHVCRARLEGRRGGGDKGRFKELFFSNHRNKISVRSVMHPIKVWLLPTDSLDPVTVPPEAGPLAAAAKAAGCGQLLPGFICRRMCGKHELFPLSEVPSMRKQLGGWVVDDVAELLRRSDRERKEFMAEWVLKSQERAARGLQAGEAQGQAGKAEAEADDD